MTGLPARFLERLSDVRAAVMTFPSAQTWRRCFLVYAVFVSLAFPVGLASGFLQPRVASLTPTMFVLLPIYLFLRPALAEELIFRSLLLPRDPSRIGRKRLVAAAVLALAAFVVSHPIHGWLTRPEALALFTNPAFLACATLLGIACTVVYLISRSLWPPVLLHWIAVIVWITLLGGQGLIGTHPDEQRRTRVVATERELAADVEQFAEGLAHSDQFTGVVLLSRNGQPLVRRTFGFADRNTQREITVDTPFALASVSKMFTAVVVAKLVEQKEISFDTTIASVLPTYPAAQSQVPVR